jgi:protocatechuate 3,4-dioxygenase alpha subunit
MTVDGLTPFQTIGPYFQVLLRSKPRGIDVMVTDATRGDRISIEGAVLDGAGKPISDALVELWQADASGRYRHPGDPRSADADPAFSGSGRAATDEAGRFIFKTIRPGAVPGPDGATQAPHIMVSLLARGILTRYWTRLYFEGDAANESDPVLQLVPAARRPTLIARRLGEGRYGFEIVVQGPRETVFFDA